MSNGDKMPVTEGANVFVERNGKSGDESPIEGFYQVVCHDMFGNEKWNDCVENTVVTVGKNQVLNVSLDSTYSPYTVVGPYMGLVGAVPPPTIVAGDTMSSHAGWVEAGGGTQPTYTITAGALRQTVNNWNAASGGVKNLSSALVFTITGTGTVAGCFINFGTGANATIDNTGGVLFSAGTFVGGSKIVSPSDTLNISYTIAM